MSSTKQETLIRRAGRKFAENMKGGHQALDSRRTAIMGVVDAAFESALSWQRDHRRGIIIGLGAITWLTLMGWFVRDWLAGKVGDNAAQVGVGGIVGAAVIGAILSPIVGYGFYWTLWLANQVLRLGTHLVLWTLMVVAAPPYAVLQGVVVVLKLLLLVPLFLLFLGSRAIQLVKGIFFTCPNPHCSYQGLPAFQCDECGTANYDLWPNLYGLLYHHCVGCDKKLPALKLLGRSKLQAQCGKPSCSVLHIGEATAKEYLVALVGGPNAGKTNYLLTATHEITNGGGGSIRAEFADQGQQHEFNSHWADLQAGRVAAKTADVHHAFVLAGKMKGKKAKIFLYDSPGERFLSIGEMQEQKNLQLLGGIVLLVDPLTFAGGEQSFRDVVDSTIAVHRAKGENGKKLRLSVVISKADLQQVREQIGSESQGNPCRQAIVALGGEPELRKLEMHFESVRYFACSPLGRAENQQAGQPFKGWGVVPPLEFALGAS